MLLDKFARGMLMDETGGAGGGPSVPSMESLIGADLSAASSPPPPPDNSQLEPPMPAPVTPQEGGGVPQEPTQPAQAQTPQPPTTPEPPAPGEVDPSEGLKPEGVDVSDGRWQRMLGTNKYAREVAKALDLVGQDDQNPLDVTSLPPAEDVRAAFDSRSALEAMEADFLSPDPQDARNLATQWNQISPEGMGRFASELPGTLAQVNPQAYQALAAPVIQRYIDFMYEAAQAEPRADVQKAILHGAQLTEWWATGGPNGGTYRSTEDIQRAIETRSADPFSAQRQALTAQQNALNAQYAQMEAGAWNGFQSGTNSDIDSKISEIADSHLAPLKEVTNPTHFNAIRSDYIRAVHERVQANKNGMRSFQIHYEQARRGYQQDPSLREALAGEYLRMATPAANAIRAKYITDQSKAIVAQNQAANAQRQQIAQKTGPGAPGAPVNRSMTNGALTRGENESMSAFMERMMAADREAYYAGQGRS